MKFGLKNKRAAANARTRMPAFLNIPAVFMVLGLTLMLMMSLMLFSGSSDERDVEKTFQQGQRTVAQLQEAVQSFQRLLQDDQVAALAKMALENPETLVELRQYLSGRMRTFDDVRLYVSNAYLKTARTLDDEAWIIIDMILTAREHGIAPLQRFKSEGELQIAGMVAIGETDNISG